MWVAWVKTAWRKELAVGKKPSEESGAAWAKLSLEVSSELFPFTVSVICIVLCFIIHSFSKHLLDRPVVYQHISRSQGLRGEQDRFQACTPGAHLPELVQKHITKLQTQACTCVRCFAWQWTQTFYRVFSQWLCFVAAQNSLQLLCTDLISHSCSQTFRLFGLWHITLLLFKWSVPGYRVTRKVWMNGPVPSKPYHHWLYVFVFIIYFYQTLPPLAVCFYFYHFCSFNRYETGPCCLNILLFDYCQILTFISS